MDLEGRTGLVTGAAKRIGRAVALALGRQGANVILHYRRSGKEADELAERLGRLGVKAASVSGELGDPEQVRAVWAQAGRQAQGLAPDGRIAILVNNASVFPEDSFRRFSEASLHNALRVNALAPLELMRLFAGAGPGPGGEAGCVVNLLDSRIGGYMRRHVSYSLSKRMLLSLTRMAALEFAPRVRVNAVAPGLILPPEGGDAEELERLAARAPLQRMGRPEEVAAAVLFLLRHDYLTGQVIFVDGGAFLNENLYG